PPADDRANRAPSRISARAGGMITAIIAFFIGGLWVGVISNMGIAGFVDTLGAVLAPLYGILVADYYIIRKQRLNVQDLFSNQPRGNYYYDSGWHRTALIALGVAAVFSSATACVPTLGTPQGSGCMIGAVIG